MLSKEFIEEMKQKLQTEKQKRERELKITPVHTEMESDEEGNSDEFNVDEVNHDLIAQYQKELELIDAALQKIENGAYGTDDEGKEISEARLRIIPWAEKAV